MMLRFWWQYLGDGPECGNAIAVHEEIDKVAFTGSVEVSTFKLYIAMIFNVQM